MLQDSGRIAGMDLGDDFSSVCIIDAVTGDVLEEARVRTRAVEVERFFRRHERMRVAIETGTHSPWVSRSIEACGHEVIVANARRVRLVYAGMRKNDRLDAEKLARLARFDQGLLAPVRHRGREAQADLAVLRARGCLVRSRTALINHARGCMKSFGLRVPSCASSVFHERAAKVVPDDLAPALLPLVRTLELLTQQIAELDARVKWLADNEYPETVVLTQVKGVAEVTALTFVLTLEHPERFRKSRSVGAFLGLSPGQRQSGARDPGRRITKEGDEEVRRLLVQCAHRILGKRGVDSDLRRHGERIMKSGGKDAKRRAVVAVARKLAVLLHRLWCTGGVYEPLRNASREERLAAAA